jgi:hypothetical protein
MQKVPSKSQKVLFLEIYWYQYGEKQIPEFYAATGVLPITGVVHICTP